MRNKLVPCVSYSNVMATIAVFVALGGTSYAVATGSIDSREIKNNTVRSKDLRNGDVRGRDIRNGTIRDADIASDQVQGTHVLESSLGTVPSADAANSAQTAASLSSQTKIAYQAAESSGTQTVYNSGKLTISATCGAAGALDVSATTAVDNATIQSNGADPPLGTGNASDGDFDTGETAALSDDYEARDVVYTEPGGQVVVVQYATVAGGVYDGAFGCVVKGLAQTL
jgi:hypothetical protein